LVEICAFVGCQGPALSLSYERISAKIRRNIKMSNQVELRSAPPLEEKIK